MLPAELQPGTEPGRTAECRSETRDHDECSEAHESRSSCQDTRAHGNGEGYAEAGEIILQGQACELRGRLTIIHCRSNSSRRNGLLNRPIEKRFSLSRCRQLRRSCNARLDRVASSNRRCADGVLPCTAGALAIRCAHGHRGRRTPVGMTPSMFRQDARPRS